MLQFNITSSRYSHKSIPCFKAVATCTKGHHFLYLIGNVKGNGPDVKKQLTARIALKRRHGLRWGLSDQAVNTCIQGHHSLYLIGPVRRKQNMGLCCSVNKLLFFKNRLQNIIFNYKTQFKGNNFYQLCYGTLFIVINLFHQRLYRCFINHFQIL